MKKSSDQNFGSKLFEKLIHFGNFEQNTINITKSSLHSKIINSLVEIGKPAILPLTSVLGEESSIMRQYAILALSKIGDPQAVDPLIAILGDKNENVRRAAVYALGKIGDPQAVDPLIAILGDKNESVCYAAEWALIKIGNESISSLITALGNENIRVRRASVQILGEIGNSRATLPLIIILGSKDRSFRIDAARALVKIGEPTIEVLIEQFTDPNRWRQNYAAWALGQIGKRAIEPLVEALLSQDETIQGYAAGALASMGEMAVEPLINLLHDEDKIIQGYAAAALASMGEMAVEPLISLLPDEDKWVRYFVIRALDKISHDKIISPIIDLLNDITDLLPYSDRRICDYAYKALQKIGTPEALKACEDWIAAGNEYREVLKDDPE